MLPFERFEHAADSGGIDEQPVAFAETDSDGASREGHHIDLDVAAIFDPFGNAVHTALSFPVLGEGVLITGAGPIGHFDETSPPGFTSGTHRPFFWTADKSDPAVRSDAAASASYARTTWRVNDLRICT